ncbi:MAG: hypothetical protein QOG03_1750 [Actinomycetota bacterium]|jgi:uncharacterized cupredoxin-like copper-binding protein|nr:hypothetical protein [Actinomycetota bacterium]
MRRLLPALAVLVALAGAGCKATSHTSVSPSLRPGRTVAVTMLDIDFDPASIQVSKGDVVRFQFTNRGNLVHEAFIGDAKAQTDHEKAMTSGHDHMTMGDTADQLTLAAGKTGQLSHLFDKAGTFYIGCHEVGHYTAGMRILVTVT